VEKLQWLRYHVENMYNRLDTIPACDKQTDGQTSYHGIVRPMHTRRAVIQELSYRKQIARQLRTQYVQGTHRPKYHTVTLKSRLRVTQCHWKRNHWTDHTRLTIGRVI